VGARLLAAADAYDAMTHDRPHRVAMRPADARAQLGAMVRAGTVEKRAADAALEAAGAPALKVRQLRPAGLTDGEVEVLRLIAHGRTNKEIARALVVTEKTAGHHVKQIYAKTGSALALAPRSSRCATTSSSSDRSLGQRTAGAGGRRAAFAPAKDGVIARCRGRGVTVRSRHRMNRPMEAVMRTTISVLSDLHHEVRGSGPPVLFISGAMLRTSSGRRVCRRAAADPEGAF
jgi:DNA-binding CsgD family transcriptional regulator